MESRRRLEVKMEGSYDEEIQEEGTEGMFRPTSECVQ